MAEFKVSIQSLNNTDYYMTTLHLFCMVWQKRKDVRVNNTIQERYMFGPLATVKGVIENAKGLFRSYVRVFARELCPHTCLCILGNVYVGWVVFHKLIYKCSYFISVYLVLGQLWVAFIRVCPRSTSYLFFFVHSSYQSVYHRCFCTSYPVLKTYSIKTRSHKWADPRLITL